jgi:hypothetical protein
MKASGNEESFTSARNADRQALPLDRQEEASRARHQHGAFAKVAYGYGENEGAVDRRIFRKPSFQFRADELIVA